MTGAIGFGFTANSRKALYLVRGIEQGIRDYDAERLIVPSEAPSAKYQHLAVPV